jgi:S-adenosyl-L-methionine hydrolase (adenosine-forming)
MPHRPTLIALFTDFGVTGPYMGQMHAVLAAASVEQPVIHLLADAPSCNPRAAAYLLSALASSMPEGTLFISVVDPGVGGERRPIVVKDSNQWFVGPDNGLMSQVARRSGKARVEVIDWRPEKMSSSFHGRDLFTPVAASICRQEYVSGKAIPLDSMQGADWPSDLAEIIYIDDFGNAITGLRAAGHRDLDLLSIAGTDISHARNFGAVAVGTAFWYENSHGLIEIAVNQGSASEQLGIEIGSSIEVNP